MRWARAFAVASCLGAAGLGGACSSSSNAPVQSSLYGSCTNVDASATCDNPDASTYQVVLPILAQSCLPGCHDNSPDAAWPLTEFDDVQAWTSFIAQDLLDCTMPPIGSGKLMTREDRETILNWIVCGANP
jgi:hypothetical protein